MIKKEIVIIDKLVIGYNHIVFNAAIVAVIATTYKSDQVVFISESTHSDAIRQKNGDLPNLSYQPYLETTLPVNSFGKLIPWISKKVGDMLFIGHLYRTQVAGGQATIFTCLSSSTLLFAAHKMKELKTPSLFFLHGEIEYLLQGKRGIFNQIRAKIYRLFLATLGSSSKVLVFSEIIKEKLVAGKYLPEDKIVVIEHPIMPTGYSAKALSNEKIILGHIGLALVKKSSYLFFQLAQLHSAEVEKGLAAFRLIGKIEHALVIPDLSSVEILSKENESLTQREYERNISLIDYAVFTFEEENYVYRESGSVVDAIAFCKPIIALKHSYFNHLFKIAGNIGFLCESMQELDRLVGRIIDRDQHFLNQYEHQQANLGMLMEKHSIDAIRKKLSAII